MIRFNGSWFSNLTSEKRGKKREREKKKKKIITTSSPPPMGLPFQRFIEKAATNGFQDFVFAPCTFSTLNFLHGTNGWWSGGIITREHREEVEHRENLFSIEATEDTNACWRRGGSKTEPGLSLLFSSLYIPTGSVRVESLPRKRRLISRGKRAALNFSAGGEKGGTIALAKTRDSITSKTWGKRAVRSAWSQINSSFAMMVPRGEKHRSIFFSSPFSLPSPSSFLFFFLFPCFFLPFFSFPSLCFRWNV